MMARRGFGFFVRRGGGVVCIVWYRMYLVVDLVREEAEQQSQNRDRGTCWANPPLGLVGKLNFLKKRRFFGPKVLIFWDRFSVEFV